METTQSHRRERDRDDMTQVVRELGEALRSARQRSHKWLAWQQLNAMGEQDVKNVVPYSPEAMATLATAYAADESDYDVIHHLAIAYHAMAWDLERVGSDAAPAAWENAFFFWRKLQASRAFWQALYDKGARLGGSEFDQSIVEEFRHNLLQYLLEIHVDFIRHYYDLKQPDRAARHIELIRRAHIPPAARKALEGLVYEAMTSTVPSVAAEGHFGDALNTLDDFLNLFPVSLSACQSYLEIARQWLDQMSPSSQSQDIAELDKRTLPRWKVLSDSDQLAQYPLARAALGDWAIALGSKHWARARSLQLQREETGQKPQTLECEEARAYRQAIVWLEKARGYAPDDLQTQINLVNALMSKASFFANVGLASGDPDVTRQLLDQALADCKEAVQIVPDAPPPRQLAEQLSNIIKYVD